MKHTNTFKYLCLVLCIILLNATVPLADSADGAEHTAKLCFRAANISCRFESYIPHSLSHKRHRGPGLWITADLYRPAADRSKEISDFTHVRQDINNEDYVLLQSASDNHLSYCKREVYHLLI